MDDKLRKSLLEMKKQMQLEHEIAYEKFIDDVDLINLERLKNVKLDDLDDEDLDSIGFVKQNHSDFTNFYYFKSFMGTKLYLSIEDGVFIKRGFQLKKISELNSTTDLLNQFLHEFKLRSFDFNEDSIMGDDVPF